MNSLLHSRNNMERILVQFFLAVLFIAGSVLTDSSVSLTIKKLDHKLLPNPFIDEFTFILNSPEGVITMKTPLKADLSENIMIHTKGEADGSPLPEMTNALCELMDTDIAKDMTEHGTPQGVYPKECPILQGLDYELSMYKIPFEKLPYDIPPGLFVLNFECYEEGKEPFLYIHVEVECAPKIPGPGL